MEERKQPFRLRLNLFDGIVLIVALAVGAFLLWNAFKPAASSVIEPSSTSTVRYTIRFQKMMEGTSALVQPGDVLVDTIKNYELGTVVAVETVPSQSQILDHDSRQYVLADVPGYEDALVTVEAPCTISSDTLLLDGGYTLRVGITTYIRSSGYMGSGPVVAIEREGLA